MDADQWQAADDLYRNRTDDGEVWKHLPAARLGQRAAIGLAYNPNDYDLYSLQGLMWGESLARTGRPVPTVDGMQRAISVRNGWNADVARSDRLLGRPNLADRRPHQGRAERGRDATAFRNGDYPADLAQTLAVLADCARPADELDAADWHVRETLDIAGPRGLRPSQAAALTVRALTYADRAAAGSREKFLGLGRDDAEAAHQIAIRHRLAWHKLEALDARSCLDHVEGIDRGWAGRASTLRIRLTPIDLDPESPVTVERLVAKTRDAGDGTDGAQR